MDLANDRVRVVIECLPGQVNTATEAAIALGSDVEKNYRNLLQVVAPITSLTALAQSPFVSLIRMPYYGHPEAISEGVGLINADDWNTAGYTGTGVKVAILDGGFTGYNTLLGSELPASVTTQSFYSGSNIYGYSSHGTACAEIVFDVAPNAEFYLVNYSTIVELGNAVDYLIAQGVDIVSYSMGYPYGGPGNGTGTINEMVDEARAAGILWVSAIGNYAQRHWQGDYDADILGTAFHSFNQNTFDICNRIFALSGTDILVDLKWDDTWGASSNDYDLLLYDEGSNLVAFSANIQNGNDLPIELLGYTATYTGYYYIAIYTLGSPQVVNFHLYTYYQVMEYQVPSSSFAIPADSPNALSVGAIFWNTPTTLEPFSSRGPTKDGRIKPDLVAPDGESSATDGSSNGITWTQGGTGFFGTSASAPHAAGTAALVKQGYPSYTPAQVQAFLEGRATDLGSGGKDNLYGSGMLDLGLPPIVPPVAEFTADTTSGTAALTVSFTDQSTGTITGWSWDFGDGGNSTAQNPSHQYTTAGTYTVSLTATGPGGSDIETKNNYITVNPGPLNSVSLDPSTAYVPAATDQQFTAEAQDLQGNTISGLSFTWSVINGGGTIDQNGLFTPGGTRGVFTSTVQVEATQDTATKQDTATVIVGAKMTVTATLQGDTRPLSGMEVPLTLRLYDQAVNSGNLLSLAPVEIFATADSNIEITDKNDTTKVITLTVGGLPTITYNVTLYSPHNLVNLKDGVSIAHGNTLDMGTLKEGDAKDSSESSLAIDITDFVRFAAAYEAVPSDGNWNELCDFNRNNQVDISDFSLLYANYGESSPQAIE
ncbi:S8 family serine peptidase [Chloroflexota bacterium]